MIFSTKYPSRFSDKVWYVWLDYRWNRCVGLKNRFLESCHGPCEKISGGHLWLPLKEATQTIQKWALCIWVWFIPIISSSPMAAELLCKWKMNTCSDASVVISTHPDHDPGLLRSMGGSSNFADSLAWASVFSFQEVFFPCTRDNSVHGYF